MNVKRADVQPIRQETASGYNHNAAAITVEVAFCLELRVDAAGVEEVHELPTTVITPSLQDIHKFGPQ